MKLTKNFNSEEFNCRDGSTMPESVLKNIKLVAEQLQILRDNVGVPITVNSGYRSPTLNEAIKGSSKSQHCAGEAVDVEVPTIDNLVLAHWIAINLNFDQLILEYYVKGEPKSGWVHVSCLNEGNRKEVLTYDGKMYQKGFPN